MSIITYFKNLFQDPNKYKGHSEAVIISCFFNPQKSPYRTKAFNIFYESIKHTNHRIIECVIGDDEPQLPQNNNITVVKSNSVLWHKESLLNKVISDLPSKFKYIFWVDADVLFDNKNWIIDGVNEFKKGANIIQPFSYCVHLDQDEIKPSFDMSFVRTPTPNKLNNKVWRSFSCNFVESKELSNNFDYNTHGHVGFAWGAKREVLEAVPLYDKALVGGADHIIAHAAEGKIGHPCIMKSFTDNIEDVSEWSQKFYEVVQGKIGYVYGDLYHIWHGDIEKRQYLKRIQDFTPQTKTIVERDSNGLFVAKKGEDEYVKDYFKKREVPPSGGNSDGDFLTSMMVGALTNSSMMGYAVGGNIMGAVIGDAMIPDEPTQNTEDNNLTDNFS